MLVVYHGFVFFQATFTMGVKFYIVCKITTMKICACQLKFVGIVSMHRPSPLFYLYYICSDCSTKAVYIAIFAGFSRCCPVCRIQLDDSENPAACHCLPPPRVIPLSCPHLVRTCTYLIKVPQHFTAYRTKARIVTLRNCALYAKNLSVVLDSHGQVW